METDLNDADKNSTGIIVAIFDIVEHTLLHLTSWVSWRANHQIPIQIANQIHSTGTSQNEEHSDCQRKKIKSKKQANEKLLWIEA